MKQPLTERRNDPYRAAARLLYSNPEGTDTRRVSIGPNAAVQHVEDGAFVEAMLWVPNVVLEHVTPEGGWVLGDLVKGDAQLR